MGLGGLVRCRTTVLWKPVWFPPSNTSSRSFDLLGGMCPWRYVSASSKLFVASTSFSCTEFQCYSSSRLSCIHSYTTERASPHHVAPGDLNMHDEYTSGMCVCVCARTAGDIIQKHTVATFLGCTRQISLEWSHSQIEIHAIFYRPSEPANTTYLDRLQASELPPTSLICLASHRIPGVVPTAGFSASCRSSWLIRASCAGLRTDMSAVWPA